MKLLAKSPIFQKNSKNWVPWKTNNVPSALDQKEAKLLLKRTQHMNEKYDSLPQVRYEAFIIIGNPIPPPHASTITRPTKGFKESTSPKFCDTVASGFYRPPRLCFCLNPLSNFFFVFFCSASIVIVLPASSSSSLLALLSFYYVVVHSEKVVEVQRGFEGVPREFAEKLVGYVKGRWEVEEVKFCYGEIG